jgi:hypothetical protein
LKAKTFDKFFDCDSVAVFMFHHIINKQREGKQGEIRRGEGGKQKEI